MKKIHLTQQPYLGRGACSWNESDTFQVTEDINEVTCKRCLNAVTPARTVEELRTIALAP